MTETGAHQAVTISALTVGGVYFLRKLTPGSAERTTTVPPLGRWLIGFGVSFFAISVLATISPGLGGWMAILLAAGTLLINGTDIATEIQGRVQ